MSSNIDREDSSPSGMLAWPSYVLGRLHSQTRAAVEQDLAHIGLALREYFTLVYIDAIPAASQQQIADRAQMDRSDLVKLLDRLEARGFITRNRDSSDRRRHVLALTPAGAEALQRGTEASRQATQSAFAALSSDELQTLHTLALKALGEEPTSPREAARP